MSKFCLSIVHPRPLLHSISVCRYAFITTLRNGVQVLPTASVNRIFASVSLSEAYTGVAAVATHISCVLLEQADIAMMIAGRTFLMSRFWDKTAFP